MIELNEYGKKRCVYVNEKKINWIADCRDSRNGAMFTRIYTDNGFVDVQETYDEVKDLIMEVLRNDE